MQDDIRPHKIYENSLKTTWIQCISRYTRLFNKSLLKYTIPFHEMYVHRSTLPCKQDSTIDWNTAAPLLWSCPPQCCNMQGFTAGLVAWSVSLRFNQRPWFTLVACSGTWRSMPQRSIKDRRQSHPNWKYFQNCNWLGIEYQHLQAHFFLRTQSLLLQVIAGYSSNNHMLPHPFRHSCLHCRWNGKNSKNNTTS